MNKTVIAITILKKLVFTFKWKKSKSKVLAIIIAFLLALSMCTLLAPQLFVSAHSPAWSIPTQAYLNATPNPIGIGQQVTIDCGLSEAPPTANGTYGDRWNELVIWVVRPDDTWEISGPFYVKSIWKCNLPLHSFPTWQLQFLACVWRTNISW